MCGKESAEDAAIAREEAEFRPLRRSVGVRRTYTSDSVGMRMAVLIVTGIGNKDTPRTKGHFVRRFTVEARVWRARGEPDEEGGRRGGWRIRVAPRIVATARFTTGRALSTRKSFDDCVIQPLLDTKRQIANTRNRDYVRR